MLLLQRKQSIMLQLTSVKNVSLENVQFPANSVVLLKYSERATKFGSIDTTIKYVSIDGVKDGTQISCVKTLLSALLAEWKTIHDFNKEYSVIKDEKSGQIITDKSGIQAKRIFAQFLSGNTIYRTNSKGELASALVCEKGVRLRDTALNIRDNQAITSQTGANLRTCIHVQSKAIVAQSTYLTSIDEMKNAILSDIAEEQAKKEDKKAIKKEKETSKQAA